ncbi:hypothetical protein thsps21_12900 [Pseudomonas sp. No.21]|uniref:hypothetical protein n=1 Tax=Pseudomonas tohonis TaxID=2725477 RepID=UPI001F19C3CB|nr:hypothetical protein [Pseudomonas tohonis]GJN44922.1 hypothetical protein TUM20249_09080 [Pseudomonas tohonis]
MARYEARGELMPRHIKALSSAYRMQQEDLEKRIAMYGPGLGDAFKAGLEKQLRDLKDAMREVREIAAQQRLSRKHRAF